MAGQNTLDVYYPQVLGPSGLDPVKVDLAISRIYDFLYRAIPIDPEATNSTIITDGFVDQLLLKLHLTQILLTHETFFASTSGVSWNAHQLNYQDKEYQIPGGSTTNKFIYWQLSKPSSYQTSANIPTLGENDYIIAQYNAAAGTVKEVWQSRTGAGGTGVTVTGSGTTNTLVKFSDGVNGVVANSNITDNNTVITFANNKPVVFTGVIQQYAGLNPTDGQILIGNTGAGEFEVATITGTANQVLVANAGGSITLSLPQSINTTANVIFNNVTSNGTLTAPTITAAGAMTINNTGGSDLILTTGGNLVFNPTGNVKFGTFTSSALAPVLGYITIMDAGGTLRNLAVV